MATSLTHLHLFINGFKQNNPCSRQFVEVVVKDTQDNLISTIRENATVANKDIQDYSALLVGLKKASGLGAHHITIFLDNQELCDQILNNNMHADHILSIFYREVKELLKDFDSVTVKPPVIQDTYKEFYV